MPCQRHVMMRGGQGGIGLSRPSLCDGPFLMKLGAAGQLGELISIAQVSVGGVHTPCNRLHVSPPPGSSMGYKAEPLPRSTAPHITAQAALPPALRI